MSHDHGPLEVYEITWETGHVETIQAHQVSYPHLGIAFAAGRTMTGTESDQPPTVRFHAEIGGHWRLILSAREADIRTIRLVTAGEPLPNGRVDG